MPEHRPRVQVIQSILAQKDSTPIKDPAIVKPSISLTEKQISSKPSMRMALLAGGSAAPVKPKVVKLK